MCILDHPYIYVDHLAEIPGCFSLSLSSMRFSYPLPINDPFSFHSNHIHCCQECHLIFLCKLILQKFFLRYQFRCLSTDKHFVVSIFEIYPRSFSNEELISPAPNCRITCIFSFCYCFQFDRLIKFNHHLLVAFSISF